jgi:ATP-dependent DNA helicase RecG
VTDGAPASLASGVDTLRGVGPALAAKLQRIRIYTALDLLLHLPARYQDRTRLRKLAALSTGDEALIAAEVADSRITYGRRRSWLVTLKDDTGVLTLRFFHFNDRQRQSLSPGMWVQCFGEARIGPNGLEMVHPEYHVFPAAPPPPEPRLTPVYPTTEGLAQKRIALLVAQALDRLADWRCPNLAPWLDEVEFADLKSALMFAHRPPVTASATQLAAARSRIALDEILANIVTLKRRARARALEQTTPLPRAQRLGAQLLHNLGFELTTAQRRVTTEVLLDLERSRPMLRLLQGDVGSGKTVIAAFAAIRAAEHGAQTAIMAPTEILAEQHYLNFSEWLTPLGITVTLWTGQLSRAERNTRAQAVADGEIHVVVGTHALFEKELTFAGLALVIIDEQHRFGVHQRMALRSKGLLPHQLVMTATPIPRTLTMALYADMDVSVIDELPKGRRPISTHVVAGSRREEIIARVARACAHREQAYWVCTLIEESESLDYRAAESTAAELRTRLPQLRVGLLHGRMSSAEKAQVMADFKAGGIALLVSTTVIEVGVDVPNASLMVIENSERFGLAQLHQLRGRIGRGSRASHCVLLYQLPLSDLARKRLATMRETEDGFRIAEADLALRGPGDVLGPRQTGEQSFRVADLARDGLLVANAAELAGRLLDEQPALAEAVVALWSPTAHDYTSV